MIDHVAGDPEDDGEADPGDPAIALDIIVARAFAPSVRVNCIMAGPFLTDISRAWDMEAFERNASKSIPLGRGGRPDEIVGAALYLVGDASSYTTGAILKVDGGMAHSSS